VSVLVTGAAGFVAATLIDRLLARGDRVLGLDNFSRGSRALLGDKPRHPGFTFEEADLSSLESFRSALGAYQGEPIREVWHLAANSDIPAGVADMNVDLRDTFMTTFNTLSIMEERGIKRLYFSSSSAIYGDHGERSLAEDSGPLLPLSNYGAMKLASEAIISAAAEKFLETAALFRFPNVVGAPATHGVILDFVRRLKTDRRVLQVLGNGSQKKAYLHISDLVEAMLFVQSRQIPRVDIVNIGPTDSGVTVRQIAEETVQVAAPGAELAFGTGDRGWVGDVPRFRYSTDKLQKLGWQPKLDSLGAIRRAIHEICKQECLA
jgi:UDP-glucose 4-epimerase